MNVLKLLATLAFSCPCCVIAADVITRPLDSLMHLTHFSGLSSAAFVTLESPPVCPEPSQAPHLSRQPSHFVTLAQRRLPAAGPLSARNVHKHSGGHAFEFRNWVIFEEAGQTSKEKLGHVGKEKLSLLQCPPSGLDLKNDCQECEKWQPL